MPEPVSVVSITGPASTVIDLPISYAPSRLFPLEPASIGFCEFTLRDPDREFDPTNSSGKIGSGWEPTRTQLNVRVNDGTSTHDLFTGWFDDWPGQEAGSPDVRVRASDGMKYLSEFRLPDSMWAYEIENWTGGSNGADLESWYRFDEKFGRVMIDHGPDEKDGLYHTKDGSSSRVARKFRRGPEPVVPYGPNIGGYDIGEHNNWSGTASGIVNAKVTVGGASYLSTNSWSVLCWYKGRVNPVRASPSATGDDFIPGGTNPWQQPVWTVDETGTGLWNDNRVGLFISTIGDFVADRERGGTEDTRGVTSPAGMGHDGDSHMVFVGRQGVNLYCSVDDGTRQTNGTLASTADLGGILVVGGQYSKTGVTTPFPWTTGEIGDLVFFDDDLTAAEVADFYQAGANGLFGSSTDTPEVETLVSKIIEIVDYQIGTEDTDGGFPVQVLPTDGMSAMEYLHLCERSELGRMFFAGDGSFIFKPLADFGAGTSGTSQVTFADDGTASSIMWVEIDIGYSIAGSIFNEITVEYTEGKQIRKDTTSIAAHGTRSLTHDTILATAAQARTRAVLLRNRYDVTKVRVSSITVRPKNAADSVTLLGLEIADRVTVKRAGAAGAGAATFNETFWIEGIEHQVNHADWTIKFYLSPYYGAA